MYNIDDIKVYLEELKPLLNCDNVVGEEEHKIRAGKFLSAQYEIAVTTHTLTSELFKRKSFESCVFANLLNKDQAKNVTEKKHNAEANPEYQEVHERIEEIESNLFLLKTMAQVYRDAHVFHRQHSKKEYNKGDFNG